MLHRMYVRVDHIYHLRRHRNSYIVSMWRGSWLSYGHTSLEISRGLVGWGVVTPVENQFTLHRSCVVCGALATWSWSAVCSRFPRAASVACMYSTCYLLDVTSTIRRVAVPEVPSAGMMTFMHATRSWCVHPKSPRQHATDVVALPSINPCERESKIRSSGVGRARG